MKVGMNLPAQFPFGSTEQLLPVPFEMVQQVLFIGNADELARQFGAYARNGLEHVVLANLTGVIGATDEIMARAMDLPALNAVLSEL